jgi:hypothetical protein
MCQTFTNLSSGAAQLLEASTPNARTGSRNVPVKILWLLKCLSSPRLRCAPSCGLGGGSPARERFLSRSLAADRSLHDDTPRRRVPTDVVQIKQGRAMSVLLLLVAACAPDFMRRRIAADVAVVRHPRDAVEYFSDTPEASPAQLRALRRVGRPPLGAEVRQLIVLDAERREAKRRGLAKPGPRPNQGLRVSRVARSSGRRRRHEVGLAAGARKHSPNPEGGGRRLPQGGGETPRGGFQDFTSI